MARRYVVRYQKIENGKVQSQVFTKEFVNAGSVAAWLSLCSDEVRVKGEVEVKN